MTDKIREQIEMAMAEKGKRRVDLAREADIAPPNLTRMLSGRSGEVPDAWKRLFTALDLELVVQPKEKRP